MSLIVVHYLYFSDDTESVLAQNSTYSQNSRVLIVSRYLGFLREGGGGWGLQGYYVFILNFNGGHFMY